MSEKTCRFTSNCLLGAISKHKRGIIFLTFLTTSFACYQAWTISPLYKSAVLLHVAPVKIETRDAGYRNRQIVLSLYQKMDDVLSSAALQLLIKENNLFPADSRRNDKPDELSEQISERLEINDIVINDNRVFSFKLSYVDRNPENAEAVINALSEKLKLSAQQPDAEIKVLSCRNEPQTAIYPRRWLIIGAGLFGGFFLSAALAVLMARFNSGKLAV